MGSGNKLFLQLRIKWNRNNKKVRRKNKNKMFVIPLKYFGLHVSISRPACLFRSVV